MSGRTLGALLEFQEHIRSAAGIPKARWEHCWNSETTSGVLLEFPERVGSAAGIPRARWERCWNSMVWNRRGNEKSGSGRGNEKCCKAVVASRIAPSQCSQCSHPAPGKSSGCVGSSAAWCLSQHFTHSLLTGARFAQAASDFLSLLRSLANETEEKWEFSKRKFVWGILGLARRNVSNENWGWLGQGWWNGREMGREVDGHRWGIPESWKHGNRIRDVLIMESH